MFNEIYPGSAHLYPCEVTPLKTYFDLPLMMSNTYNGPPESPFKRNEDFLSFLTFRITIT
jgi:hypothetical protein